MENNVAFLYPGQGSQQVGMGFDLYQAYPQAKKIFDQADQLLGFSLSERCFKGPEEELNSDLNAQLAVYTVSCVVTDILRKENVLPDVVSGYSSGFYSAAYASGCFDFATGLNIVRRAGEILLDEGKKIDGGMAVVFGIPCEKVESICREVGEVEVAIKNTTRQTVIAGINSSIRKAMELSLNEGALDVYPLSVATAYHSRFVEQSNVRLLQEIKDLTLKDPHIPLISYLSLDYVPGKEELKTIMADQLSHPVLWVDLIKKLRNNGTSLTIEVGPGAVVSRTVRWIDRDIEIMVTATKDRLSKVIERYRMQDAGCKIQDSGCKMQDARYKIQNRKLYAPCSVLYVNRLPVISDRFAGCKIQDLHISECGFWIEKKVKNNGARDYSNENNFYRS